MTTLVLATGRWKVTARPFRHFMGAYYSWNVWCPNGCHVGEFRDQHTAVLFARWAAIRPAVHHRTCPAKEAHR